MGIGAVLFLVNQLINQKETAAPKEILIQHFGEAEVINPLEGPKFDVA